MPLSFVGRASLLGFVAALLLVATVGALTWLQGSNTRRARAWVDHTYQVLGGVDQLGIALRDAETGQRGFLLTGRDEYLDPYRAALDRVTALQGTLAALTSDNPEQHGRLAALAPLVLRKLQELGHTIQLRRDGGPDAALKLVQTDAGLTLMNDITSRLDLVRGTEESLLAQRNAQADADETTTRMLTAAGIAVALLLLGTAARMLTSGRAMLVSSETRQRQLATELQVSLDSLSQGLGTFSGELALLRWNHCFAVLLGVTEAALRPGLAYDDLLHLSGTTADGEPILETADQVRHGQARPSLGEPIVYERRRASDGRSLEIRRTPTGAGGFVLTITDTTERVRNEETARAAQRLQAMGQLTGGIAHDFNNLLTIITGNLELAKNRLRKLPDSTALIERIERAEWGARRGATLTQQLLAFARRQPLMPTPIILSEVLPNVATLLRRTLGEHIDVRVVDAAGLWPALADIAQVESALLNLALNARDAMPGGGRLTIELANKVLDRDYARTNTEVTAGDYVMIAVSDTGTGMAPDVLARAFEPFFTTKELGKGTGLGLAMVFGFVKQSGGHLKIYSEPGEGTTVRMYLPRAVGAVLAPAQRSGAPMDLPRGSATVLVVEDEPGVREVAVTILRELGYRVVEASDGQEALRMLGTAAGQIDLLLCDVVLPGGMKGDEVARRVSEVRPQVRVLFMSGYTENAIVHGGRLDDGVNLIGKPFQREALARKVSEVLAGRPFDSSQPMPEPGQDAAGNVVPLRPASVRGGHDQT